jgi:hypothetical protein
VVFSRTGGGRIWYVPGFAAGRGDSFSNWRGLVAQIRENVCTPIVGWGLLDNLVGPTRVIARRWADMVGFALTPQGRDDLPQVTQYLSVMEGLASPAEAFESLLRDELARRFPGLAADRLVPLDDLLTAARELRRDEPHEILARLPFRIYLTTNVDDQLHRALLAAGRDPRVEVCRWHSRPGYDWPPSVFDSEEPGYTPSLERPLIYHLFGRLSEPETLVLTEEDYFDFLIGMTRNFELVPAAVRKALARSALLFLGFRVEQWGFRVLFRFMLDQGKHSGLSARHLHVATLLGSEEGRNIDPDKARRYLERFLSPARISIYWGSADDFLQELSRRARESGLGLEKTGGTP